MSELCNKKMSLLLKKKGCHLKNILRSSLVTDFCVKKVRKTLKVVFCVKSNLTLSGVYTVSKIAIS
jgi:hypothetical protein